MHLNVAKSELISDKVPSSTIPWDQIILVKPDVETMLGVPPPLFDDKKLHTTYWNCDEFKRVSEHVQPST